MPIQSNRQDSRFLIAIFSIDWIVDWIVLYFVDWIADWIGLDCRLDWIGLATLLPTSKKEIQKTRIECKTPINNQKNNQKQSKTIQKQSKNNPKNNPKQSKNIDDIMD